MLESNFEKKISRPTARPPLRSVGSHGAPYFTQKGPMGPPTFTQPGTQGPLLYPEGAHGAPLRSVSLPEKNFRSFAAKIFFRFTDGFNQKNKVYGWFPYEEKIQARKRLNFF